MAKKSTLSILDIYGSLANGFWNTYQDNSKGMNIDKVEQIIEKAAQDIYDVLTTKKKAKSKG